MTPEKVPMQDPGIWGYMGLMVGGFISKVVQVESVSWKWIVGLAGAIILLLLTVIGSLSFLGIKTIQEDIVKLSGKVEGTKEIVYNMKTDIASSHAKVDAKNQAQDECLVRIEREIDKMKGVKMPRLGGGDMGDGR